MSDAPIQTVRVSIRRSDLSPSFVEEERDVAVSPDATLRDLFQLLALHGRDPHARDWTFAADGQPLDWSARIGDLCDSLRTTNFRDGVLWLDLLYTVTPPPAAGRAEPPGSFAPPAPAGRLTDIGRSLGKTVIEVKKGLKGIEDEVSEDADEEEEAAPPAGKAKMSGGTMARRSTSRRATVRYYSRMNPDRMFPLLVILSKEEVAEIVKAKVKQAQSEAFQVEEGSVVEVEPVLPGCDCYPPRHALTVAADVTTSATIWVVPRVLGRVHGARVLIRQGTKVLAEVPLDVKVAKQTLAVACGLLSLAAPYMTMGLKSLKLDYESQKADGFPLYQRAGGWVAENLRPEWLGLGFLALAFLLYLWMRPRRRDVFWDVNPK